MSSVEELRRNFRERTWREKFRATPEIAEAGLVFGFGTVLMRKAQNRRGEILLALEQDEERLLALLSAVSGRQISPSVMHHVRRASDQLRRGDEVLAQIELAFARLPRLESREDAYRLFLAEDLLAMGFAPRRLARELGFNIRLSKYPGQPHVPAGHGRESGEWASGRESPESKDKSHSAVTTPVSLSVPAAAAPEAGTLASGLFATEGSSAFLIGLGALAAQLAPRAVLGALFVSIPFGGAKAFEGELPGDSDFHYTFHNDEGALQIWRQGSSGREELAHALLVKDIFYESETGIPIARRLGDTIVFDADSLASLAERSDPRSETRSKAATKESETTDEKPQLCPDPGPDVPHGASGPSIAYQAFISFLNNPQRPLLPGMAVSLINPETGRRVVYDDCRESDGTMIEAKGLGYASLLKSNYLQKVICKRWRRQGERQAAAAGWHPNEWFFAEEEARKFAEEKVFNPKPSDDEVSQKELSQEEAAQKERETRLRKIKTTYVPFDYEWFKGFREKWPKLFRGKK